MKLKNLHIIFFSLILFSFSCQTKTSFKSAENGILKIDSIRNGEVYSLDGNWAFYYKKLLNPDDNILKSFDSSYFVKVNSVWNKYICDNEEVGNFSHGTFYLKIIIPKGSYALKIKRIETAYKLWINNTLIDENGTVGKDKNSSIPNLDPQIVYFNTKTDTTQLVLQVSNYHHRVGGIQNKILIGKPDTIKRNQRNNSLSTFFMMGSFLIIGIYFIFTFLFGKKSGIAPLYFSLTILLSILFASVNGESLFTDLFRGLNWEIVKKLDFISNFGRIVFFILFLKNIFIHEKLLKDIFSKIVQIILFSLLAVVLFTKATVYTNTLYPFLGITLITFVYISVHLAILAFKNDIRATIILIGIIVVTISMLNDLLSYSNIISTPYLANFGLFIFILFNAIILALNISSARSTNTKYSKIWADVNNIRTDLSHIRPFELEKMLKILADKFNTKEAALFIDDKGHEKCEISYNDGFVKTSYLKRPVKFEPNNELFEKIRTKRTIVSNNVDIVFPIFEKEDIKGFIYFKKLKNIKHDIEVMQMLHAETSSFLDNYQYFYSLENINRNLETIIEKRIEKITIQKEELLKKQAELDFKLEELDITNSIVDDLNKELLDRAAKVSQNIEELENQNNEITHQKEIIIKNISTIESSVDYSKVLQNTLLKNKQKIRYAKYFEIDLPKDVVSGDTWFAQNFDNHTFLAVIDSTGHNISSTFITLLIKSLMDDLILEKPEYAIERPDLFISQLKKEFFEIINKNSEIEDDFDILSCSINIKTGELHYSGENLNVYLSKNEEIIQLDLQKKIFLERQSLTYKTEKIQLEYGDKLYMQTDGFVNQIRKKDMRKFGNTQMKNLINEIHNEDFDSQKEIIKTEFMKWKQGIKQVDDFLLIGFMFTEDEK